MPTHVRTAKFVALNTRRPPHRKLSFGAPYERWSRIKLALNDLILNERLATTLQQCKEIQGYAEELIEYAKKDDLRNDRMVESEIISAAARKKLYEVLVPRYGSRLGHVTRVVNKWLLRPQDGAQMGFLEFVDRPGEIRPAKPVGYEKSLLLHNIMTKGSRRDRRKFFNQAVLEGVLLTDGSIISRDQIRPDTNYLWELDSHQASGPRFDEPSVQFEDSTDGLVSLDSSLTVRERQSIQLVEEVDLDPIPEEIKKFSGERMLKRGRWSFEPFRINLPPPKPAREVLLRRQQRSGRN